MKPVKKRRSKEGVGEMKSIEMIRLNNKINIRQLGIDGGQGYINFGRIDRHFDAAVVFSWGDGWDHVSISYPDRCPTREEMCKAKDIFFKEDECVIQFHPPKDKYVDVHPYCLHLWRWQNAELRMPPKWMIG